MPVSFGGTNTPGDTARLFPWQVEHYLVHGGPNDPVLQSNTPPTSGGYLSWNSVVTLPPVPGTQTPPAVPLPRVQSMGAGGVAANGASLSSVTLTNATGTAAGGIYIGTVPQGAWIESVEIWEYAQFTSSGTNITNMGVFYAPAGTVGASNAPGFQPATLFVLATLTAAAATTAGAANTLYSTETGVGRTVFSTNQLGPGNATAASATQLASLADIDLYFVIAMNTTVGALTAGSAAVRVKFTGLEG